MLCALLILALLARGNDGFMVPSAPLARGSPGRRARTSPVYAADGDRFTEVSLRKLLEELEREGDGASTAIERELDARAEQLDAFSSPEAGAEAAAEADASAEREGAEAAEGAPADGARPAGGPGADEFADEDFDTAPFRFPIFDVESLGLGQNWERLNGNYLLRPPAGTPPRALIHFLGGAFVGAAPSISYRYLLEGLAAQGFLVVATPYRLEFDYLSICDKVITRFEAAALPLADEYGGLPVVGIGHSCGALLHSLITSLFPEVPRAGNVLVSWNNRPVEEAIPGFESTVIPVSRAVMGDSPPAKRLRAQIGRARSVGFRAVEQGLKLGLLPSVWSKEILPLVKEADSALAQVPGVLQAVADGTRDFTPTPDETRNVLKKLYRARRTLVLSFDDDSIDESEVLVDCLRESTSVWRMKRPMIDVEMDVATLKGTHVTPLSQDLLPEAVVQAEIRPLGLLKDADATSELVLEWLAETLMDAVPGP